MTVHRGTKAGFPDVRYVGAILVATWSIAGPSAKAQEAVAAPAAGPVVVEGGRPTPDQIKEMRARGAAGQPPGQPGQPGQPGAKPEEGKKPEGEGDKKDEGSTDSVKRPDTPPKPPNPDDFKVALDEKGNVPPFNFIGQPWPDVMQWLATLSNSSLDWQEQPNGYLNLTTQRSYKLDEVHDLINQALNARGFTSIQSGEMLRVFKIEKLDPSVVRQVNEEDLYNLKRYDYVKVSFVLPSEMEIDKAKDDVKQVLSPHAKVFPLVTTRKLLIMDSVANLRTVSEIFNQERMIEDGRIVPRNFPLKFARPEQVIETLYVILGVDPKAKPVQTDPNQQAQMMQQMEQMRQQGKDVSKMMKPQSGPQVYLAYNRQLNSVMANAPAKEMKIIEQTIALLDVPFGGDALNGISSAATNNGRSMKKYPLTTLEPENFMQTLKEIGGLSPYAEFKIDAKSKTLFALATEDDHKKINGLIDQFDGTGRQFEVIWLRRLPADAVAATIFKLMGGQAEEEEDDNRGYYGYWFDRDRNEDKDKPLKGFGVEADIENNRLLLWANDAEMKRVQDLLVKLGEIPSGQVDERQVRLIESNGEKPSAELLQQIRDAWAASGGNDLIIKTPPEKKPAAPPAEAKKTDAEKKDDKAADPAPDRSTGVQHANRVAAHFAQLDTTSAEPAQDSADNPVATTEPAAPKADPADSAVPPAAETEPAAPPPANAAPVQPGPAPLTITVTEDGKMLLSSPDTAALDRMEELIDKLSPPEKRFKVYRLKHIPALHMYWDLTDYFKEDMEEDEDGGNNFMNWYFGGRSRSNNQEKGPTGLAKRRKLMITYDVPSNSILVSNASSSQLEEIELLIKEFDRPAPSDSTEIRQTASIKVYYSRPSVIAAAIKEVYRDLLSTRDKEFDRGEGERGGERSASAERVTILNYGGGGSDDDDRPSSVKVGFDGALSLGADDVSGVLIVSAQKGIFADIVKMVRELDLEASPQTTVHVHRVSGNVSAEALQKAVNDAVGTAWLGNRPEQTGGTGQQQAQQGEERRDRDRDRDRGDRRRRRDNDND